MKRDALTQWFWDVFLISLVVYYFQKNINNPNSEVVDLSKVLLFRNNNADFLKSSVPSRSDSHV